MRLPFSLAIWDKATRSFVLAARSLWLHKLRAMLSVLGIIIGTSAVIALMAFGEGSMQDALEDIQRQGATNIIVRSIKPIEDSSSAKKTWSINYGLTDADYESFQMLNTVVRHVPMRIFPQELRYKDRFINGRVVGTTANYQLVTHMALTKGRFLTDKDEVDRNNVCVLGAGLAAYLYPFEDPLGQMVIVANKFGYKVVGIVSDRMPTGSGTGRIAEEFNYDLYIPLSTNEARFGERVTTRQSGVRSAEQVQMHQVTLTVEKIDDVRSTGEAIRAMLSRSHRKNDWEVIVPLDRLLEAERAKDRYKMLLVTIAGISLVVGGIGIMNIMLATVTERTREIGIRRALGAKRRDITLQFLIEAVVQTSIGGLAGVLLGLAIVFGVPFIALNVFGENLPAKLHVPSMFLSLFVAIGVGVLFGWYPARRASRLDPIEALRHE